MPDNKYLKAMQQASVHVRKQPSNLDASAILKKEQTPSPEQKRKFGRPPGKRSNPDWEQLTIYIRKDTKRAALHRLMDDTKHGPRDLSEVIEQLVAKWAKLL